MPFKRAISASALMIFTALCLVYLSQGESLVPNKSLSTFPKQVGEWSGKEDWFDQRIYKALGVDDSFLATYTSPRGQKINLYIGFYTSQREGDLIHSPKNCMPGSGWEITHSSLEELSVPNTSPDKIKMIKLTLEKGVQKQTAVYWYQSHGRFIASEYMQKIYLVIDSITMHRTDGSFVRLIAPVADGAEERTLTDLKDFAKHIIPILNQYIPS